MYDHCSAELQAKLRANREKKEAEFAERLASRAETKEKTVKMETSSSTSSGDDVMAHFSGVYELQGVVTHKGRSADSGHYIAWVRQEPGSSYWWKYDDDKVSEVRTPEVMDLKGGGDWHTAYLNIYRFKTD